jgi:hypothetical protein
MLKRRVKNQSETINHLLTEIENRDKTIKQLLKHEKERERDRHRSRKDSEKVKDKNSKRDKEDRETKNRTMKKERKDDKEKERERDKGEEVVPSIDLKMRKMTKEKDEKQGTLSKKQLATLVKQEFLHTERLYVENLNTLIQVYICILCVRSVDAGFYLQGFMMPLKELAMQDSDIITMYVTAFLLN